MIILHCLNQAWDFVRHAWALVGFGGALFVNMLGSLGPAVLQNAFDILTEPFAAGGALYLYSRLKGSTMS